MATTADQTDILFKQSLGVTTTNTNRDFFEEPFPSRAIVFPDEQIWTQKSSIPGTAPGGLTDGQTSGVVQRFIDKTLTAVPGVSNSFYHADLIDTIPFNLDSGGSYNYVLKDSTDTVIPFGQGDWIVDIAGGVLTFFGTVPSNMPPKISFFKYVGTKGLGAGGGGADEFTDLTDTPNAYTGVANQLVAVNSGETALEFVINLAGVSGGRTITGGSDANDNLTLRSTSDGTKGSVIIDETTSSTTKDTGALVVEGGVGIEENLNVGGDLTADSFSLTGNMHYSWERFTTTAAPIVISTSVALTMINMDTDSATATLADGTTNGQIKIILIESRASATNTITVTVSTLNAPGATKIKFRNINQGAQLIWTPSGWMNFPAGGQYLA